MRRRAFGLFLLLVSLSLSLSPVAPAAAAGPSPKDQIVVSGDVVVERGTAVDNVVVADGDVLVRGTVTGDIVAIDGLVTIRGSVGGDVVTVAKHAALGRRAHVGGDIKWVQERPVISPGAIVAGKVERFDNTKAFGLNGLAIAVGFWVVVSVSLLIGGLLLLLIAPAAADAVVRAARARRGASIVFGVVLLIVLPILAFVLLVTVVGTPLGIGLLLLIGPLYAIAYLASALVLGRRFVKSGGRIAAFLLGLLILRVLALIPFAGALISLLATIFGLGALYVALRRARSAA